jgi:hypothetical protein
VTIGAKTFLRRIETYAAILPHRFPFIHPYKPVLFLEIIVLNK